MRVRVFDSWCLCMPICVFVCGAQMKSISGAGTHYLTLGVPYLAGKVLILAKQLIRNTPHKFHFQFQYHAIVVAAVAVAAGVFSFAAKLF